jgi:hypothetical protein
VHFQSQVRFKAVRDSESVQLDGPEVPRRGIADFVAARMRREEEARSRERDSLKATDTEIEVGLTRKRIEYSASARVNGGIMYHIAQLSAIEEIISDAVVASLGTKGREDAFPSRVRRLSVERRRGSSCPH